MKPIPMAVAAAAMLCAACAPINTCLPMRPLETGETFYNFHVTFPFNNFARISLQATIFHGIAKNEVLGCTITPALPPLFIGPNNISYGHYWMDEVGSESIQLSLGPCWYNPQLEMRYAIARYNGETASALKAGAGLMFNPSSSVSGVKHLAIVPEVEYSFQYREGLFNVGVYPGVTRQVVSRSKAIHKDATLRYEYSRGEIDTIKVNSDPVWGGYEIVLKDQSQLNIKYRDPYADCYACALITRDVNAYTASSMHRNYWIYKSSSRHYLIRGGSSYIVELNMPEVLQHFESGGALVIEEEKDVAEKSCRSINPWSEDIYIDIGYVKRD